MKLLLFSWQLWVKTNMKTKIFFRATKNALSLVVFFFNIPLFVFILSAKAPQKKCHVQTFYLIDAMISFRVSSFAPLLPNTGQIKIGLRVILKKAKDTLKSIKM
jgi:hypothetical protein